MILYEFEGKNLFQKYKIPIPKNLHVTRQGEEKNWEIYPAVVKAQVQSGKRGKGGGIIMIENAADASTAIKNLLGGKIVGDEVLSVLIEEKKSIVHEYYLAITYDTIKKIPILVFSGNGGMDVEEGRDGEVLNINSLFGIEEFRVREMLVGQGVKGKDLVLLTDMAKRLWKMFEQEDARLAEINPLAKLADGTMIALDSKVILDDDAGFRHDWSAMPERTTMGRRLTERERAVRSIDQGEFYYRGTAGKYIEMEGDIACLFSGGGASISMMDALYAAGGKPANYTEYSGNPPREKVYELAKIVVSKSGLKGIWIVGGVANFTHIGETMAGIADALAEIKPTIPIIIRRAGPHENEGRALMEKLKEEHHLDITWYGREISMTETAKLLMNKIR